MITIGDDTGSRKKRSELPDGVRVIMSKNIDDNRRFRTLTESVTEYLDQGVKVTSSDKPVTTGMTKYTTVYNVDGVTAVFDKYKPTIWMGVVGSIRVKLGTKDKETLDRVGSSIESLFGDYLQR